jgi:Ca2+-binding EF-hand superfamily protein
MSGNRDLVLEASQKAKNLQIDEIHRIKAAWDKCDLNHDGTVSVTEVDKFLSNLNISLPQSRRAEIIKALDRNGNGTIEFVEFVVNYERGLFKNL